MRRRTPSIFAQIEWFERNRRKADERHKLHLEKKRPRPQTCFQCRVDSIKAQRAKICKLCAEGIELKRYFDGSMRHFDGLMAWTECPAMQAEVNRRKRQPQAPTPCESKGERKEAAG